MGEKMYSLQLSEKQIVAIGTALLTAAEHWQSYANESAKRNSKYAKTFQDRADNTRSLYDEILDCRVEIEG